MAIPLFIHLFIVFLVRVIFVCDNFTTLANKDKFIYEILGMRNPLFHKHHV